jgi:hypothetical protein
LSIGGPKWKAPFPHKNLYFGKTFKFQFLFFWSQANQNGPQQEKKEVITIEK